MWVSKEVSKRIYTQRTKNTVTRRCSCQWPNRCVSSARRHFPSVMSDSHSWVDRPFHTRGLTSANERSPRRVLVRCARHVSMSDGRSCRRPVTDTSVGKLPPDTQAGGRAVPYTPARRSWIEHINGLEANVAAAGRAWCARTFSCIGDKACCDILNGLYGRRYRSSLIPYSSEFNSPGVLKWTSGLATCPGRPVFEILLRLD